LVQSGRRGEPIGHRCFYAGLLALLLFWVYWQWFGTNRLDNILGPATLGISQRARFAGLFFNAFMGVQLFLVVLFTPLYTAGALGEVGERRVLEFLFVTDLTDREIVIGTLASRLARLLVLLLTGLPILSLLELMGGLDPNAVLLGFLFTLLLAVVLGSV